MTIEQAVQLLIEEKQKGLTSRFPCRAIMVKNLAQYLDLLRELHSIPDIADVSAEELFSSSDIMPRYDRLTNQQYADRWVILPGVSEYLRLFSKNEAETQRFGVLWSYQAPASNTGRVIIPLWGCETQWHDKTLHLDQDLRQTDFYYDCVDSNAKEQEMKLVVLSDAFEAYAGKLASQNQQVFVGLKAWHEYWQRPTALQYDQILITARANRIQPTGTIQCHVIQDRLSFIRLKMPGSHILNENNCPEAAQALLFEQSLSGKNVEDAILSALNVSVFIPLDIMSKWKTLTMGQKELIILWINQHPDESYLDHCIQRASSLSDIENRILHEIFDVRAAHEKWVQESQTLVQAMGLIRDDLFFQELDKIPVYEERLCYLGGKTQKENVYLLRMIGRWLREDAHQVYASDVLKEIYPELSAYLRGEAYEEDLRRYFRLYKSHKLENTLPQDEETYFSGIHTDVYDYRYTVLSDFADSSTIILWIDALGAEWLPLLLWALIQQKQGEIRYFSVTQANLPTETDFNEQWKQMDVPFDKLNQLDKLAHKGIIDDPDYYACVENQLRFVKSIAEKACAYFKNYHRVIITGDHGTSRLAARFFHKREGIPLPKGCVAGSHGRYCKTTSPVGSLPQTQELVKSAEDIYVVFNNYDHFTQPGYAAGADDEKAIYGEIHGGGTPEERLVPVVVYDSKEPLPLAAAWKKNPVKISMKKAKATLIFNQPVQTLQASIGTKEGTCSALNTQKEWMIVFEGIPANQYQVTIVADNKLIFADPLEIHSALGGGEGDLP